jgi:hypothetical protein
MTKNIFNRRRFLRDLGLGAASLPFISGLPSLNASKTMTGEAPKRLVVMFSPNGTLPDEFWPDEYGDDVPLQLKPILKPLEAFSDRMLILKGVHNKIRGDGDNHMRGMS